MRVQHDIVGLLRGVQARRRRLQLWGGVAAALAVFVGVLLIATGLEWRFFLLDEVRWGLGSVIWGVSAYAGWRAGWGSLMRPLDERGLAAMIDRVAPELQGDLLAAWELEYGEASADSGSSVAAMLRMRVRDAVSEAVGTVDIRRLLPMALVRRNLVWGSVAVAVLCGLSAGLQDAFVIRALRVGLPFLNLERLSSVRIRVVEPGDSVRAVAKRSQFDLTVAVDGVIDEAPVVQLEGASPVVMQSLGGGRFRAHLLTGDADVAFRVRAGDGMTKKTVLWVRDRPVIQKFVKNYQLPAYLDSAVVRSESDQGTLEAVQGTVARVEGTFSEAVSAATVVFIAEDGPKAGVEQVVVSESVAATGKLSFPLEMAFSGRYMVRSISAEWGIPSDPSGSYEVRVVADNPPAVSLEIPETDLTLPAGAEIRVTGSAEEDYRLKRFVQQTKQDAGRWMETDLGSGDGKRVQTDRRWNLPAQVPPGGATLLVRLMAEDAKGLKGESRTVKVHLLPVGVVPSESATLSAQRKVQKAVEAFDRAAKQVSETSAGLRHMMEQRAPDPAKRDQALESLAKRVEQAKNAAAEVAEAVEAGLKQPVTKSGSEDIAMVAEAVNRAIAEGTKPLEETLARMASAIKEENRDAALEASRLAASQGARSSAKSQAAREAILDFVAARESAQLVPMATALAALKPASGDQETGRGEESAKPPQMAQAKEAVTGANPTSSETKANAVSAIPQGGGAEEGEQTPIAAAQRKLGLADAASKALQDGLATLADDARGGPKEQVKQLKNEIEKQRGALAKEMATGEAFSGKGKAALALDRALENAAKGLSSIQPQLERQAEQARDQLAKANGTAASGLEAAVADVNEVGAMKANQAGQKSDLVAARLETQAQALDASAALESRRQDGDVNAVAQRLEASRALRGIADKNLEAPKAAAAVQSLAKDLAKTEAANRLNAVKKAFEDVARDLAFAPKGTPVDSSTAEKARKLESKLGAAAEQLRNAGLNDAANAVQGSTAKAAAQEAKKAGEPGASVMKEAIAAKLDEAASQLAKAAEKAAASAAEASGRIAEMAPDLPKALAQAAEASSRAAESNRARSKDAEGARVMEAAKEQAKLGARAEGLRQALQAEAERQGVKGAEQRAAARDAEDVSAMIGDVNRPARGLEQAKGAPDAAGRAEGLESAAGEQEALGKRLKKASELLAATRSEDAATVAKAREELRAMENQAGIAAGQTAMEAQRAEIARTAEALAAAGQAADATGAVAQQAAASKADAGKTAAANGSTESGDAAAKGAQGAAGKQGKEGEAMAETTAGAEGDAGAMSAAEWLAKAMEALAGKAMGKSDSGQGQAGGQGQPASGQADSGSAENAATKAGSISPGRKAELALGAAVDAQRQEARASAQPGSPQAPTGALPGQTQPGNSVGQISSDSGQLADASGGDATGLAAMKAGERREWGRLPAQMAKDLSEGRRESAPTEYQAQVEAYFKAIADRSARRK
jgi:hypothetical protein